MSQRNNRRSSPESLTQQPPSLTNDHRMPSSSSTCSSSADNFSSVPWTNHIAFPPGYKFVPNDEDLILLLHYLKPFVEGGGNKNSSPNVPVHHVNIYDSNPEQLSKEYEKGNDKEWFFITEGTKLRGVGESLICSNNNGGSWKSITAPKKIKAGEGVVGYKTGLEYYTGKCPYSVKSDWLMAEYFIESSSHDNNKADHDLGNIYLPPWGYKRTLEEDEEEVEQPCTQVDYALCKIYLEPIAEKKEKDDEGLEASEEDNVEQHRNVAFQQPLVQQQQLGNIAFQQPHQPQGEEQEKSPSLPFISDELYEILNSHNIPDVSDELLRKYPFLLPSESE